MRRYLQKLTAVLLILCVSAGALLYVGFDIAQIQYKLAACFSDNKTEVIRVLKTDFEALTDNDEFWHNGKLYDIRKSINVGDSVDLYAFHDSNEEKLVHKIAESFEPNEKMTTDKKVHIARHRIHPPHGFKILTNFKISLSVFNTIDVQYSSWYISIIPKVKFSVISPPPWSDLFV